MMNVEPGQYIPPAPQGAFLIHGDRAMLFAALAKAQGAFKPIKRSKTNPHFKSKYAELSDVTDATTAALSANGLSIMQPPTFCPNDKGLWEVRTILAHESGAYIEAIAFVDHIDDWHKLGSAITYCRRYCLAGVLGVAPEDDDDANATKDDGAPAEERGPRAGTQSKPPTPKAEKPAVAKPAAQLRAVAEKKEPEQVTPPDGRSFSAETRKVLSGLMRDLGISQNSEQMVKWSQNIIGRPIFEMKTEEEAQKLIAAAQKQILDRDAAKEAS